MRLAVPKPSEWLRVLDACVEVGFVPFDTVISHEHWDLELREIIIRSRSAGFEFILLFPVKCAEDHVNFLDGHKAVIEHGKKLAPWTTFRVLNPTPTNMVLFANASDAVLFRLLIQSL